MLRASSQRTQFQFQVKRMRFVRICVHHGSVRPTRDTATCLLERIRRNICLKTHFLLTIELIRQGRVALLIGATSREIPSIMQMTLRWLLKLIIFGQFGLDGLLSTKNVGFFPRQFCWKRGTTTKCRVCLGGQKKKFFFFSKKVATANRTRDPHFYLLILTFFFFIFFFLVFVFFF